MTSVYTAGKDRLHNFETSTFRWLLLSDAGYVFQKQHEFVADLTPGTNEVLGAVSENVSAMVLFELVTNDADSVLVAYYEVVGLAVDTTSYVRETVTSPTRTLDTITDRIAYDAGNPDFGGSFQVLLLPIIGVGWVE